MNWQEINTEQADSLERAIELQRAVHFKHAHDPTTVLEGLKSSALIAACQAGKLEIVGTQNQQRSLSFQYFDHPMAVAVHANHDRTTVAHYVRFLSTDQNIAYELESVGSSHRAF